MKTLRLSSSLGVLVVTLCYGAPALAMDKMTMGFKDSAPPTFSWPNGSSDAVTQGSPGPCSGSREWGYTFNPSGGPDGNGYYELTYCANVVPGPTGWFQTGSPFEGSGFPTEICGAITLYFANGIIPGSNSDTHHQFKSFLWHTNVFDGNHRAIGFWSSGSYRPSGSAAGTCGASDRTHICFSIQHNIDHTSGAAYALIPVGEWTHVQWCWKHGNSGTSFVKLWINNGDYASPTAQDLSVGDWPQDVIGYRHGGWMIGNSANTGITGTRLTENLVVRFANFQLTPGFDSAYYSGGGNAGAPAPPTGLRLLRLYLGEAPAKIIG